MHPTEVTQPAPDSPVILLVEDDQDTHVLVKSYLQGMGIVLTHAYNGKEGLEKAISLNPDMVILDYDLPEMDGLTVLKSIRASKSGAKTPVVFLTSSESQSLVESAFSEGAVDFLRKPIYPSEFQARIRSVLRTQTLLNRLRFLAHNDPLTGIPNRNALKQVLEYASDHPDEYTTPYAVLLMGIDRISTINHLLGSSAGDELLCCIASRLQCVLSTSTALDRCCSQHYLARYGGDQFILILSGVEGNRSAMRIAECISEALTTGYQLAGTHQFVSVSVGVCFSCDPKASFAELIRCANISLQEAKKVGRGEIKLYDDSMQNNLKERESRQDSLRVSVRNRELQMLYQPIMNLQTWQYDAVEAIVRWDHPQHGGMPESHFMPLIHESGLLKEIGEWTLSTACQQSSQWFYESPTDAPKRVSINVTHSQVKQPRFLDTVIKSAQRARLRLDRIQLEVCESGLTVEDSEGVAALHRLRNAGIRVVVDNFGTAISSVKTLGKFPAEGFKLDKRLITEFENNSHSASLVQSLVSEAKTQQATIISSGIEKESQLKQLVAWGCRHAQGDFFSKPLPADEVLNTISHWNTNVRSAARAAFGSRRSNTPAMS